jgi:hypothetical protein
VALRHSHSPHENFEQEHLGEAHVHDHEAPAKRARSAAGTKSAPSVRRTKSASS